MKYSIELSKRIVEEYQGGMTAAEIADNLSKELGHEVPERSVIAKLSTLGVYKRKVYKTKQGTEIVRKEEYIERISKLLDINIDLLDSMEKVTKTALMLIERQIKELKS